MKRLAVLLLVLIVVMAGCEFKSSNAQENKKPVFAGNGVIYNGNIEVDEVSINSKIPGRIETMHVEEGSDVKASDVLVTISSEEIKAKENQAKAVVEAAKNSYEAAQGQVEAARSQLEKAENGARVQEVQQAESYYDLMKKTYDRVEKLYEKGAVSAQKKDEVKTQLDIAEQKLSMAKEGARKEDKSGAQALLTQALSMEQAAKSKLEQAEAALEEVRVYLNDAEINSPMDGVVTVINADEGELVSTGMSIATVSDINSPWVEVNVKETDLGKVYLGQKVRIKVPAYSEEEFSGKVVRINKKADFATKRSTNDNGDFDILSFGVKVDIDKGDSVLRPGMTAFVFFPN